MTRRFLHNTPWSSLLDAWSEVHPRLRYTIHVRDDRPPFKQAARSAPLNSAVASAACLEGRPGPVTPSTRGYVIATRLANVGEPHVEIAGHRLHQRLQLAVEEMVGAGDDLLVDHDALLGLQFFDQGVDILGRHHGILLAMHDQARGRAG